MLSGQGWTAIAGCRQFFYARYFDWAVTCSLIVLNLGLIAGADAASIAATMAAEGDICVMGRGSDIRSEWSSKFSVVHLNVCLYTASAFVPSNHVHLRQPAVFETSYVSMQQSLFSLATWALLPSLPP